MTEIDSSVFCSPATVVRWDSGGGWSCSLMTCCGAAGGQVSRTEWWPSLSDGDWQKPDGVCAARVMSNCFWHEAARNPKAQGGAFYSIVLKLMKEPDHLLSQMLYGNKPLALLPGTKVLLVSCWVWQYTAKSTCAVQHVNCSHLGLISYLLFSAELLPSGDLPLSNALWQKKPDLWINQSPHFLCFEG